MQTPIDFKSVESVPYRKTITMVNNFVISTTEFLNKFSYLCEKKLEDVSQQIQKLEITMNILEAKLGSISGLEGSFTVVDNNVPTGTTMTTTNTTTDNGIPPPPPLTMKSGIVPSNVATSSVPGMSFAHLTLLVIYNCSRHQRYTY